jgi:hypothetical protein
MSTVNTLLESANDFHSFQKDAARLASKWTKSGLLEKLGSETDKNNMSVLLENQAKQLIKENSVTGGTATFAAGTGEQYAGIVLPMVRKVFAQIAAKEFVSVQPMNLPSGLVFFLDFQYGTDKTPFTAGSSLYGNNSANFGNTAEGGFYGAGRFSYSTNLTQSVGAIASTASANWFLDMNADGAYSSSFANYSVYSVATSSLNANFDLNAVRSFYISGSGDATIDSADILPAFTRIDGGNLKFVAADDLGSGSAANVVTIFYSLQPVDNKRGDFEDKNNDLNGENSPISIPELNIKMRSEGIVAKTKKLKAVWSPEFSTDLNAYQNLDAEKEITNIMSEQIAMEVDLELLDMLIQNAAAGTEYWTAENNRALDSTGYTNANLGYFNSQGQWFQTLGTKIQKLSNIIHQRTLRGGANFMVCSPSVGTVIESIPGFSSDSNGDVTDSTYAFGVHKAGAINKRLTVYKNPYMTENTILLGYRGSQFLEAGAVFAPYVPIMMTPTVLDPETFTPRKGLATRFAKKMVRPEFFGKIYVSGLNTI